MEDAKKLLILVVDDEDDLRKAIAFDLKRKGFQPVEASSGSAALELVRSQNIDIVLSDVKMPGGDGIEFLNKTREINPERPAVVLISGFADISPEDAYALGADALFSKPFDRKALIQTVQRAAKSREEKWSQIGAPVASELFKLELRHTELDLAIQDGTLGFGRGGFFVRLDESFPDANTPVAFRIQLDRGPAGGIEGQGTVRWVRPQASQTLPAGCGIEIGYLAEPGRAVVIDRINQLKPKAYIPIK